MPVNIFLKKVAPRFHARRLGVVFGKNCHFINVSYGSEPYLISMGDNVTLSNVFFNTHDGSCRVIRDKYPDIDLVEPIRLGSNIFIGTNSIILPGVQIEDNTIIGAGSIVSRKVYEGNAIYAGNPARKVCSIHEWVEKNKSRFKKTKRLSIKEKEEFYKKYYFEMPAK